MITDEDIQKMMQVFVTKHDLSESLHELDERWNGKHQEVLSRLDAVFKELKDMSEESVIHQLQHGRIDEDLKKIKSVPVVAEHFKSSQR